MTTKTMEEVLQDGSANETRRHPAATSEQQAHGLSDGVCLIAQERKRQLSDEGYTDAHDDEHCNGELAMAAACYAAPALIYTKREFATGFTLVDPWPWDDHYDKRYQCGSVRENPGNFLPDPYTYTDRERIDMLIKAGALIAAEIERLIRARVTSVDRATETPHPRSDRRMTTKTSDEFDLELAREITDDTTDVLAAFAREAFAKVRENERERMRAEQPTSARELAAKYGFKPHTEEKWFAKRTYMNEHGVSITEVEKREVPVSSEESGGAGELPRVWCPDCGGSGCNRCFLLKEELANLRAKVAAYEAVVRAAIAWLNWEDGSMVGLKRELWKLPPELRPEAKR